jgi:hypothetical protein
MTRSEKLIQLDRVDEFLSNYAPVVTENPTFKFLSNGSYRNSYYTPRARRRARETTRNFRSDADEDISYAKNVNLDEIIFIVDDLSKSIEGAENDFCLPMKLNFLPDHTASTKVPTFSPYSADLLENLDILDLSEDDHFRFYQPSCYFRHTNDVLQRNIGQNSPLRSYVSQYLCPFVSVVNQQPEQIKILEAANEYSSIRSLKINGLFRSSAKEWEYVNYRPKTLLKQNALFAFKVKALVWHHSFETFEPRLAHIVCLGTFIDIEKIESYSRSMKIFQNLYKVAFMNETIQRFLNFQQYRKTLVSNNPELCRYWPGIVDYITSSTIIREFDNFRTAQEDEPEYSTQANSLFNYAKIETAISASKEKAEYDTAYEAFSALQETRQKINRHIEDDEYRIQDYNSRIDENNREIENLRQSIAYYKIEIQNKQLVIEEQKGELTQAETALELVAENLQLARTNLDLIRNEIKDSTPELNWASQYMANGFAINSLIIMNTDGQSTKDLSADGFEEAFASPDWNISEIVFSTQKPSIINVLFPSGEYEDKQVVAGPFTFKIQQSINRSGHASHSMHVKPANSSAVIGINESGEDSVEIAFHPHANHQTYRTSFAATDSIIDKWAWCCEGELLPALTRALKNKDTSMIFETVRAWTVTCNGNDEYGKKYKWFPKEPEVFIDAPPIDISPLVDSEEATETNTGEADERVEPLGDWSGISLWASVQTVEEEAVHQDPPATSLSQESGEYNAYFNFQEE